MEVLEVAQNEPLALARRLEQKWLENAANAMVCSDS